MPLMEVNTACILIYIIRDHFPNMETNMPNLASLLQTVCSLVVSSDVPLPGLVVKLCSRIASLDIDRSRFVRA